MVHFRRELSISDAEIIKVESDFRLIEVIIVREVDSYAAFQVAGIAIGGETAGKVNVKAELVILKQDVQLFLVGRRGVACKGSP